MADAKSVINLGLGKIAASRVSSISPPKSAIERHVADGYPVWRDSELELRTWHFTLRYAKLTQSVAPITEAFPDDGRTYRYALPPDCIRIIRDKASEWEQRGLYVYSALDTLTVPYVARVPENQWAGTFTEVMACRVGCECVEFATQSNTKGETIETKYEKAIVKAGKMNAYVVGPQDVRTADYNDEWITERYNPGGFNG